MAKKFLRCMVCSDIHYGEAGPEVCPTCDSKNAYEEVTVEEAKKAMKL